MDSTSLGLVTNCGGSTMDKRLGIVTKGWHEIASSLEKTSFFQEYRLNPKTLPLILADLVRRYTTVIGCEAEGKLTPIGSETFFRRTDVQCDTLTDGHVAVAILKRGNVWVLPAQNREVANWSRIEGQACEVGGKPTKGWKVQTLDTVT